MPVSIQMSGFPELHLRCFKMGLSNLVILQSNLFTRLIHSRTNEFIHGILISFFVLFPAVSINFHFLLSISKFKIIVIKV